MPPSSSYSKAIQQVCREFVLICRKLELLSDAFVAIDGSKFKAVNNRDRNFTKAKLKRRLEQIDESKERYLGEMASADLQDNSTAKLITECLQEKVDTLKKEIKRLKKLGKEMLNTPDQQISLTDPDARSMATSGRGTGMALLCIYIHYYYVAIWYYRRHPYPGLIIFNPAIEQLLYLFI